MKAKTGFCGRDHTFTQLIMFGNIPMNREFAR